jgi:alpha-N-arabinofuranosidase
MRLSPTSTFPRFPGFVAAFLLNSLGEFRPLAAAEYHVAITGKDSDAGAASAPFRTLQAAADRAQPGDTITVHAGIYRERVNPPRGGESPELRIVYRAAPGETVEIRGSEVVRNWTKAGGDVWKATVPESLFGGSNPFRELIRGDWFDPRGRPHHTGAVYLDGQWLSEAPRRDEVMKPVGADPLWFAEAGPETTEIWAQFKGVDPNTRLVEINVRRTVFYPDRPGRNFITVRGFALRHAATPWAPPTAEQVGVIGTHWSRGWIIESNVVSHSVCSGIALGKHGDRWDNTSADTAEGYVKTIERALANGWTRENIGHHVVRNNEVSHCEQAGIVGSLGAAFSVVSDNRIHDIHVRRLFSGAEMAGIKFHAAIDTVIRGNHIHRTVRGLWLDWMAQGTRVSGNLFHDNAAEDLFMEVNHGPCLVDNNLFLSRVSLLDMSEGGAFAHNLFGGRIISRPEPGRETPYHPAHATVMAGLKTIRGGDNRFYNNVFVGPGSATGAGVPGESQDAHHAAGYGLWVYDERPLPSFAAGNVHLRGARPSVRETEPTVLPSADPQLDLAREGNSWFLRFVLPDGSLRAPTRLVTSALLGEALVPRLPYRAPDDSELRVDRDYRGRTRSGTRPVPGPFEGLGEGLAAESGRVRVW